MDFYNSEAKPNLGWAFKMHHLKTQFSVTVESTLTTLQSFIFNKICLFYFFNVQICQLV